MALFCSLEASRSRALLGPRLRKCASLRRISRSRRPRYLRRLAITTSSAASCRCLRKPCDRCPFKDSCFDTVLLSDVLEHIPNPEILIAEVARILRSGGCTVIGVPFLYYLHETPHDFNRYTRYQLERLLKNAGLKVEQLEEVGGSPEVLADIMSKTLSSRPRIAATFVAAAEWLLNRELVRRVSDRTRANFPLAYLAVARKEGAAPA